jgi:hypothetical protein
MKESTRIENRKKLETRQRNFNKGFGFDGPFTEKLVDIVPGALFEIVKVGEVHLSIPGIDAPFRGSTVEDASHRALLFMEKNK